MFRGPPFFSASPAETRVLQGMLDKPFHQLSRPQAPGWGFAKAFPFVSRRTGERYLS